MTDGQNVFLAGTLGPPASHGGPSLPARGERPPEAQTD